ncbi:autotransporter domain-containing protein [Sphingomonas naphthae]|uniref:Autotransporter domain-containing protein n=1 Tax=Sphingomonas naphthae TaxID=1813468 RepID=A0ABY7THI7_9SPHN|nr:autotransporter domain-containing protein [Sphingomonas naphthae]WCT72523.1 autotransporter domain-containing protein [Sphingomonas naphthae]
MRVRLEASRAVLAFCAFAAVPAIAQQTITVNRGTTRTTQAAVAGTDSVTVAAGGAIDTTANPAINWNGASTGLAITNSGTIRSTASGGRAIGTSGSATTRGITLTNNAGGLIESADDAIRINNDVTAGTIRIDNFGTIRTTNGGQAIDFDAIASGTASVAITNYAGGVIRSVGQDAIRPGQGAIVTNAGLIYSEGPTNNNYDGIDWQQRSGTVVNQNGGTISGLRHGITSDIDVNVTNLAGGSIIGRNGSGIGSDGTGTVVNFGTIEGSWDGLATNGDGDGVDIDLIGTVTNSGTIRGISARGVDSGGRPNGAEGIAIGGGVITNTATGLISGGRTGILVDDGGVGGAYGATTITNAGRIEGFTGPAIQLVGEFADTITNSGTIASNGAVAIQMGGGNDTLALVTGSTITGRADGGTGNDLVSLSGTGSGTFGNLVNFERLAVVSGNWTLSDASTFATSTTLSAGANLTTATPLTGAITNNGTITLNQAANGSFAGTLAGNGTLIKAGAGTLSIGSQAFTGATLVSAGRLDVLGTLPSTIIVARGATLGGTGTTGPVTVGVGGIVAPGQSIGTLTVNGAFVQSAGSTYQAEIAPTGAADRIVVNGAATIQSGAILQPIPAAGTYTPGTRFVLLTATGGVSGAYTLTGASLGTGTELRLGGTANAVFVDVARTGASLPLVAQSTNQLNTAIAVSQLGVANAAYAAITLVPENANVRYALDQLSGEIHASARTAMVRDADLAQRSVLTHLDDGSAGMGLWAQGIAGYGEEEGDRGAADGSRSTYGGMGGFDFEVTEGIRIGAAGGYTRDKLVVRERASRATLKTTHALGYLDAVLAGFHYSGGVGYDWVDVDTRRAPAFGGFSDVNTASYDGGVLHGFARIGAPIPAFGATIEPFASIQGYRVRTKSAQEAGGAASLGLFRRREAFAQASVGTKVETRVVGAISARGSAAYVHVFGQRAGEASVRFGNTNGFFPVRGTTMSSHAAAVSGAVNWALAPKARLSVSYDGLIGTTSSESTGRLTFAIGF